MLALKTVLCPVDFSPATPRQISIAAELCRALGARLVLHHNRHSLGTGASVGWMWNADHHGDSLETLEARLRACHSSLPGGITSELLMTEGPVSRAVLAVSEQVKADLVVLTAHGTLADDHASITDRVLEDGRSAVLVLHEPSVERRTPHFGTVSEAPQVVLVPTDLAPVSKAAVDVAFDLARALPIELHLLHLLPGGRTKALNNGPSDEEALERLRALVPDDLADRVTLHVEHGDPADGISRAADKLAAACIVIGEHTRGRLGRWFGRDPSWSVVHQARCPVWYVPGTH